MRQKAEREEAAEKEKVLLKAAKEKEIARLREQQEKSQDLQAALDEMNALRAQEEVFKFKFEGLSLDCTFSLERKSHSKLKFSKR